MRTKKKLYPLPAQKTKKKKSQAGGFAAATAAALHTLDPLSARPISIQSVWGGGESGTSIPEG